MFEECTKKIKRSRENQRQCNENERPDQYKQQLKLLGMNRLNETKAEKSI